MPDLKQWKYKKTVRNRKVDGVVVPRLTGSLYLYGKGKRMQSAVVHRYKGRLSYCAWGLFHAEHCGAYAVKEERGWSMPIIGCPQITLRKKGKAITGFDIFDGKHARRF